MTCDNKRRWQNLAECSLAQVLAVPFNPARSRVRGRARCSLHPSRSSPMTPSSPKIVYGQPLSPNRLGSRCADHCRTSHRTFPTTSFPNSLADPIASFPTGFPCRFDGAIALANELQEDVSSGCTRRGGASSGFPTSDFVVVATSAETRDTRHHETPQDSAPLIVQRAHQGPQHHRRHEPRHADAPDSWRLRQYSRPRSKHSPPAAQLQ